MNQNVIVWGVELTPLNLDDLVASWRIKYPTMTEAEIEKERKNAESLIPKGINYIEDEDPIKDPSRKIAFAVKADQQVLLQWPKGSGKTTSVYYVAQQLWMPLITVQFTGSTGVDTVIGRHLINKDGTYWVDGLIAHAIKFGYWLVLDELNMALPEVTAALHSLMDDRRILVLDEKDWEVLKRHENTRLFAAINPNEDYAGTKEMNAALVDRFAGMVLVSYADPRKEREIILSHKKVKIDDSVYKGVKEGVVTRIIKVASSLRRLHGSSELTFECSTRNLIDWACWCSVMPVKEAAHFALINKADEDAASKIIAEVNVHFRDGEMWGEWVSRKKADSAIEAEAVRDQDVDYSGSSAGF